MVKSLTMIFQIFLSSLPLTVRAHAYYTLSITQWQPEAYPLILGIGLQNITKQKNPGEIFLSNY